MKDKVEELKRKHRKLTFLLGQLIYKLYQSQAIRFLYTSGGIKEEEEVGKMLRLLDYLNERIKKFEEIYYEEEGSEEDREAVHGYQEVSET